MAPKVSVWRPIFLDALADTGNISESARRAGISRQAAYDSYHSNKKFAAGWDDALEQATDKLELEARRRAHEGTTKPVFYQGAECGYIQEYSDTLMIFLLKAHRPDKFRENSTVEHTGDGLTLRVVYDDSKSGTDGTSTEAA